MLDGELLQEATYRELLTSQVVAGKPTYYGLGFQVSRDARGRTYYGHIGNGVGGYSNFYVYPETNTVLAILINCTDPKVQPELDAIIENLWEDLDVSPETPLS